MTDDTERTLMSAVGLTLTVLGAGLLASLAAGVVFGLIIDDIGRGIGQTVAVGMAVTAIIGVALNILFVAVSSGDDGAGHPVAWMPPNYRPG